MNTVVQTTDLRSITRDAERCYGLVRISNDIDERLDWLLFGEAQLCSQRDRNDGQWRLEAHLGQYACDFEHDSAWAFKLPLIGLTLGAMAVSYSLTHFVAWIDPNIDAKYPSFYVPRAGYDPVKHPDTITCDGIYDESKDKWCKWNTGKPHPVVPEGLYVPPFDRELYEAVRGKRVEIVLGVRPKPHEEEES